MNIALGFCAFIVEDISEDSMHGIDSDEARVYIEQEN